MSDRCDYVFGFGSIMDTSTHATWQTSKSCAPMLGSVATISKRFGYRRQWNFRSDTGFTALGVSRAEREGDSRDINGVLFRIPPSEMENFDRREAGYERIAIPLDVITFHPELRGTHSQTQFQITNSDRLWIYIPHVSKTVYADENHPLLQSYVDTVLRGCLEWGGVDMAEQFILTTGGWAAYFLNDTPSSRRPWLFRREYNTIDELLKKYSELTHFGDRRHPEEFAASFNQRMRGTWSIPPRNPNFTGRDLELSQLHSRFTSQDLGTKSVVKVEVSGMGGVGKSQLATEFCYRHFPLEYGLVIWMNAESADSLVANYRQLLADLSSDGSDVKLNSVDMNKSADDVICEVKTRLFRCTVPWLLVLDNLEDRDVLDKFVPHGASKGHVLITTRHLNLESEHSGNLDLGCFSTSESLELLRRSAGSHNIANQDDESAAKELADRLGNLPLALGMAAAYMRRCDVGVSEYLERSISLVEKSFLHDKLNDYTLSVASSLSLSLEEVKKINPVACESLELLSFLGPDDITKALIRQLLRSKRQVNDERLWQQAQMAKKHAVQSSSLLCGLASIIYFKRSNVAVLVVASLTVAAAIATSHLLKTDNTISSVTKVPSTSFSPSEYEEADLTWNILKSFSLLSVKGGKGSIHRLLQQALRSRQSQEQCRTNITVCITAMLSLWRFNPAKTESWKDSLLVLEHVKSAVSHSLGLTDTICTVQAARLSKETAIFSAMSLNDFSGAKTSLDFALNLYQSSNLGDCVELERSQVLLELGRIFRYQGMYGDSKHSLEKALGILRNMSRKDFHVWEGIANILHEIGLLELRQHNLKDAEKLLNESLHMRRRSYKDDFDNNDAECAATLHQIAAVHVAKKPPSLDRAKELLLEALSLSSQIGQRAATLKQLARVTIRQGLLDDAESYLERGLELYLELYSDNKLHMNIAAVQFQRGALALQRERLEEAWLHFMECLQIRRHVYAYARSLKDANPIHLEVSCVLHELGCVGFAQQCYSKAKEMFSLEREILVKLEEAVTNNTAHPLRIHQARLTNLTWLRKCAQELGDDHHIQMLLSEKSAMKSQAPNVTGTSSKPINQVATPSKLERDAMQCRLLARKFALGRHTSDVRRKLKESLNRLTDEIKGTTDEPLKLAAVQFRDTVVAEIDDNNAILNACDILRDVLRSRGVKVNDSFSSHFIQNPK